MIANYEEFMKKVNTVNVITAGTDLNDYIDNGWYFFYNANTPSNKPSTVTTPAGYLEVVKRNSGDILQLWFEYNKDIIWHRQKSAGTWMAWTKVGGQKDFLTAGLNANTTVTTASGWANTALVLNTNIKSSGSTFSLTNGKIKVNRACRIRISANIMVTKPTNNTAISSIMHNNEVISSGYNTNANDNWETISLVSRVIDVSANDTIALAYGADSANVELKFAGAHFTYLTVEEV